VTLPPDYAAGGALRIRASKLSNANPPETLTCVARANGGAAQAAGTVDVTLSANLSYLCTPTLPGGIGPGSVLSFALSVTSSGTMNDAVLVHGVAFEYTATQ
jgi:hypothetical protein